MVDDAGGKSSVWAEWSSSRLWGWTVMANALAGLVMECTVSSSGTTTWVVVVVGSCPLRKERATVLCNWAAHWARARLWNDPCLPQWMGGKMSKGNEKSSPTAYYRHGVWWWGVGGRRKNGNPRSWVPLWWLCGGEQSSSITESGQAYTFPPN